MNRVVEDKFPMLIAQVEPPQNTGGGDYFYRTHAPGISMAQGEGVYVVNLTNLHRTRVEIMTGADVLVLNNICDPDILPLIQQRKANGKLTVYEVPDDLGALEPWNPVYFFYKNKENLALACRLASLCDALQVSVPELRRLYGTLNDHCEVFPNQILHVPPERPFKEFNEVVVGWAGSHGHVEDLAEIAEPLSNWVMTKPNVVLHLMCSDPIWKLFGPLPLHKKRRTPPGSIDDYYNFLSKVDVGIAHLKDTPFNRSRSDVKFLEYAVSGVVPVLTCLEPYQNSVRDGETGFLYESPEELIHILNRLLQDVSHSQKIARNARQYVVKERLELEHGQDRIAFYIEQFKRINDGSRQGGRRHKGFEEWSKLEGAVRNGRHLQLLDTQFETSLHNGLVAMQIMGNKTLARQFFQKAEALEPESYLPHLFGSSVAEDPIASLRRATELKPNSLRAQILLGEELVKKGEVIEAFQSFESAVKVYPDYEIPYLRAAALLTKLGEHSQAQKLLDNVKRLKIHCVVS